MKKRIEAGVIADLGTLIRAISDALFKWMDRLDERGAEVNKPYKDENGNLCMDIETKDHKHEIHVVLIEEEGEDEKIYDIEITPKGGTKEVLKGVPAAYVDKRLEKWMVTHDWDLGGDNQNTDQNQDNNQTTPNQAQAATHIRFSLKKVTSATRTDVVLTAITGNTQLVEAGNMLNDIVNDDVFCDTLTAEPQTFEAVPCPDGTMDVNLSPEPCDPTGTYAALMAVAVNFWGDLKTIHWNAVGHDFFELHEKLDEYIQVMEGELDILGELAMEYEGIVPNPIAITGPMPHVNIGNGFTRDVGFQLVKEGAEGFIRAMNCAYVNMPHDVQAQINAMIRYWSKEAEYKLCRQQAERL